MSKLHVYHGKISSCSAEKRNSGILAVDMILYDMYDADKAPTRIQAFGGLAQYIYEINGTDAEERYLDADYYYDNNLYLHRIEIHCKDGRTAKVLTQDDFLSEELMIFGPQEYIEVDEPEPMDNEQEKAWYEFRFKQINQR